MRFRTWFFLAVVVVVVAGCGTQAPTGDGSDESPTPRSTSAAGSTDPLHLIGVWRVSGTNEPDGTLLRFDGADVSLWRDCGALYGSWRADHDGHFVAEVGQWGDGSCATSKDTALTLRPPWLVAASGFQADGEVPLLLDDRGRVVARLAPATGSPPADGRRSAFTDLPRVDDQLRHGFAEPAPLSTRVRPASEAALAGRWTPVGTPKAQRPQVPFLRLDADRSWSSSDGCNGSMGRWTVGPAGRVLATSGVSTLIACHNVPVEQWWASAGRAAFDGATLVLFDANGEELGRLVR